MKYVIGCDIGGSFVKIGTLNPNGQILSKRTIPLPELTSPPAFASWVARNLRETRELFPEGDLLGAGIGIPGPLLYPQGILHDPPNLPFQGNIPLREMTQAFLSFPVIFDNDATVQTLGEKWQGLGKGISNFLYITFGTGVGGGIVIGGEIYRGTDGMAGEIGHLAVNDHGRPCLCGSRGCLETYASINGIAHTLKDLPGPLPAELEEALEMKRWKELPGLLKKRMEEGETRWQKVWDIFADALGTGMGSLINLFNPRRIILSGGLSYYSDYFLNRAIRRARHRSFDYPGTTCEIVVSNLKEKAGIIGAAYLILSETGQVSPASFK